MKGEPSGKSLRKRGWETVFTTRFEAGDKFQKYISAANEESRRNSSFIIFKNVFEGIFRHGFFNGLEKYGEIDSGQ